jgi:predicted RND superfamily exporter protein
MIEKFIGRIAGLSARNPWKFLAAAAVICGMSIWALMIMPTFTSRNALLSAKSDVVQRFNHYMENFGAASDLIIAIEGAPRQDLEEYARELSKRLETLPEVKTADANLDLNFMVSHSYTMLPRDQFDKAATFMDGLLNMDGKVPANVEEALSRSTEYFSNPPSIPTSNIDMSSAKNALNGMQFFLDEWLRWLDSETTPAKISWEKLLADQPEAQKLVVGNGFYDSHDGKMLFLFIRKAEASEAYEFIKPFYENIEKTNETLKAEWKAAGRNVPTTGLAGMPSTLYEEFSYIGKGVTVTIIGAGILVFLVIFFVMKSFRRGIVVFGAMGIGSVWSLGLIYLTVGHMTMVTSAFTAILFGLGVDYGVFISSRILEEMKRGVPLMEAIMIGTAASSKPVITAGIASTLVFAALATVEFTGFSELGLVAACGVVTVQISTFLMLPAIFVLIKPKNKETTGVNHADVSPGTGRVMPKPIAATVVLVAVALAAFGAWKGLNLPFDYDVLNMLPADSQTAIYSKKMVKESDYQSEVVIMMAKSLEEAREMVPKAEKLKTVVKVQSPMSFFPADAAERVEPARRVGKILSESDVAKFVMDEKNFILPDNGAPLQIASMLEQALEMLDDYQEASFNAGHGELANSLEGVRSRVAKIIAKLKADPAKAGKANQAFLTAMMSDARYMVSKLSMWKDAKVLTAADLPDNLRSRFFGKDGSVAMYVYPAKSVYDIAFLKTMMTDIYAINPTATGFPTTHNVQAELAKSSFFTGTLRAIIVSMLFLLIVLHSIPAFLVAALPLLVGEGWMLGILAILGEYTGFKYNYANIIALPLLMALALDYGVWFAHRYHELVELSPWQVLKVAGLPIMVAALTTLAGVGCLALAEYRGISTLGIAVTIGLVCCLSCALVISPAVGQLFRKVKK